jgi:ElaA protein
VSSPLERLGGEWRVGRLDDLTTSELLDVLVLRARVFVVEQECPFADPDELDRHAFHVLGRVASELVAYARVVPASDLCAAGRFPGPTIGRVVVAPAWRGKGLGVAVCERALDVSREAFGHRAVWLAAQARLERMYGALGFVRRGAEYLEDGISHIDMVLVEE